jgi:hypothetical protein
MKDKIDRTIMKALAEVEKLEKLFANNGRFENAVSEIGGDIGWFGDVRENLKTLFSNIEELHMGAVSHMDMESVAEADDIMSTDPEGAWAAISARKEELMDMGMEPEEAQDQAAEEIGVDPEELEDWLDKQFNESRESLNYLKKLAGIVESEHEEEDDDADDDDEKEKDS